MAIHTKSYTPAVILDYGEAIAAVPKPVSQEDTFLADEQTTVPADREWPVSIMREKPCL